MTYNRRKFIRTSTLGAVAASSLSINCQTNLSQTRDGIYMGGFSDKPIKKIRAAFIGLNRGGSHLRNFATIPNTEVVALSDLYEENIKREQEANNENNTNRHESHEQKQNGTTETTEIETNHKLKPANIKLNENKQTEHVHKLEYNFI